MTPIFLSEPERITLRDQSQLMIRPIRPDDAPRLQALHSRLRLETIYLRFLSLHPVLQAEEAKRFANLDYRTRMAFVATELVGQAEWIVGVARYAVDGPLHPNEAEYAIVIEDRYQGRGLGTLLMDRLVNYACANGIEFFVGEVSIENEGMLHLLHRLDLPLEQHLEAGVWEVRIQLKVKSHPKVRRPANHRRSTIHSKPVHRKNLPTAG